MIDKIISSLYRSSKNEYNLDITTYTPITSKSFKVITKNNEKYIIKKTNDKSNSKYLFLKNEGVENIIYPIKSINNLFSTRLINNSYCNESYCILPFLENNNVLNQTKVKGLLESLKQLHYKTSFYKKLNIVKSKSKIDEMISYLNYKFSMLEAFIRTIEARPFDEFSIPILKNYHYILKAKQILIEKNKYIIDNIKNEKSVLFCFLHNNPKLDHLIINNGEKYLISIDNGVIGIPSLDIAKYYIENCDIDYDISKDIIEYFKEYEDDFYLNYFIFIVLFIYVKNINIEDKDYISTQTFIYSSNSIKKFIKNFNIEV